MNQRTGWTGATLLLAVLIVALAGHGRMPLFTWLYGTAYFLLGVVLLGTVARWWRRGSPILWRPAMLSLGAIFAAIETGWRGSAASAPAVDRWMVALLGLVLAAILARFLPVRLARFWFGVDRRAREPRH